VRSKIKALKKVKGIKRKGKGDRTCRKKKVGGGGGEPGANRKKGGKTARSGRARGEPRTGVSKGWEREGQKVKLAKMIVLGKSKDEGLTKRRRRSKGGTVAKE